MAEGLEYTEFVEAGGEPDDEELVCDFYLKHDGTVGFDWAAGAVAAESSIGTWDPDLTTMRDDIREMGARVVETDESVGRGGGGNDGVARVAYPTELFEDGSVPQILSSVAGNVFGLSEVVNLRLEDVRFPEQVVGGFEGPALGIDEVKSRVGADERPVVGTIVKPKLGLRPDEHAEVAYEGWMGGLDVVKDDENLADMSFNGFEERVETTLEAKREAEDETGERKLYFPNITAPAGEMRRRADVVVDNGGDYVMVDVLTAGWGALQEIRDHVGDGIGIHGHRAGHAAFTRLPYHGVSMLAVAKFARLCGVDNLHAGAVVGKMEGGRDEVREIYDFLRSDWGVETTIPVASGGLHPGVVGEVVGILGADTVVQAGGGVHGHPDGTRAGGRAMRDAAEAAAEGVPVEERAEESEALAAALDRWGTE
jgi:ribulose-bisphosphate carboxylase large chain